MSETEFASGKKSIRRLLFRSFAIIILLSIISGGFALSGLDNTSQEYNKLIDEAIATKELSDSLKANLLEARQAEKDFTLQANVSKITTHQNYIELMKHSLNNISDISLNSEIAKLAKDSIDQVESYQTTFSEVANLTIQRGGGIFGADVGKVGELRDTVHNTEDRIESLYQENTLNETSYHELNSLYLTLRRHEKDYLLRHNDESANTDKYVVGITTTTNKIKSKINDMSLNESIITLFESEMNDYQTKFDNILLIDTTIKSKTQLMNNIGNEVETSSNTISKLAIEARDTLQTEVNNQINRIFIQTTIGFLVAVVVAGALSYYTTISMTKPIKSLQDNVASISAGDMTQEIEFDQLPTKEIGQLADNFNQMKSYLRDILQNAKNNADTLNTATEELTSAAEETNASSEEVSSTSNSMSNAASQQAEMIADTVLELSRVSDIVDDIINSISENSNVIGQIALQTNILALNAGIEASRAGDYGRGFAVVAENVRRLSEESKSAAEQITEVASSISETLQDSFNNIRIQIEEVAALSEETAASAEEVAAAAEEVTASMEQVTTSSQRLSEQAAESLDNVSEFKL